MIFDGHDYKTWLNQNRSIEPRRQRLKSTRMLSNVIFVVFDLVLFVLLWLKVQKYLKRQA